MLERLSSVRENVKSGYGDDGDLSDSDLEEKP